MSGTNPFLVAEVRCRRYHSGKLGGVSLASKGLTQGKPHVVHLESHIRLPGAACFIWRHRIWSSASQQGRALIVAGGADPAVPVRHGRHRLSKHRAHFYHLPVWFFFVQLAADPTLPVSRKSWHCCSTNWLRGRPSAERVRFGKGNYRNKHMFNDVRRHVDGERYLCWCSAYLGFHDVEYGVLGLRGSGETCSGTCIQCRNTAAWWRAMTRPDPVMLRCFISQYPTLPSDSRKHCSSDACLFKSEVGMLAHHGGFFRDGCHRHSDVLANAAEEPRA